MCSIDVVVVDVVVKTTTVIIIIIIVDDHIFGALSLNREDHNPHSGLDLCLTSRQPGKSGLK